MRNKNSFPKYETSRCAFSSTVSILLAIVGMKTNWSVANFQLIVINRNSYCRAKERLIAEYGKITSLEDLDLVKENLAKYMIWTNWLSTSIC